MADNSDETVSAPIQDVEDEPKADDKPQDTDEKVEEPAEAEEVEAEHTFESHVVETGTYQYYGGWTCQSGTAYNGVEKSKEHPTKNG